VRLLYHHRTRAREVQKVHITEMVNAFRKLGHQVDIVSLVDTEKKPADVKRAGFLAPWQVIIRRVPFVHELIQLAYNLIGIPLLLWKVHRCLPDFIYERYSLLNFAGVIVARFTRKSLVLEVNSPLAIEQGRDGHITAVQFAQRMESRILSAATRVVVVSESLRKILTANGAESHRLIVMHNAVNPEHFEKRSSNYLRKLLGVETRLVIGFAGWFRNWHRLDFLIEAFHMSRVARQGGVLFLVGDGPEMNSVRKMVADMKLQDSVILAGAVPHSAVPDYENMFDIAVHPAANEYCCPMKLLEYMALAKPIIAPRQNNVLELLSDCEAVLFPPGDKPALAKSIATLAADPVRAARLGLRARAVIDERQLFWVTNARRVCGLVQRTYAASAAQRSAPDTANECAHGLSRR
jgi:glycosyltransferase involved in cell wall biosynthesis